MEFVLTFVFLFLLFAFLFGYFSYYNVKKHLPKCDVIYILDDDLKDGLVDGMDDPRFPDGYNFERMNKYKIKNS